MCTTSFGASQKSTVASSPQLVLFICTCLRTGDKCLCVRLKTECIFTSVFGNTLFYVSDIYTVITKELHDHMWTTQVTTYELEKVSWRKPRHQCSTLQSQPYSKAGPRSWLPVWGCTASIIYPLWFTQGIVFLWHMIPVNMLMCFWCCVTAWHFPLLSVAKRPARTTIISHSLCHKLLSTQRPMHLCMGTSETLIPVRH
jgi:hypothetical protein